MPDAAQNAAPAGARGFARVVAGHTLVHASMSGMRLAAPLLALHLGLGTVYVGGLAGFVFADPGFNCPARRALCGAAWAAPTPGMGGAGSRVGCAGMRCVPAV